MKDGRATGVALADGREFRARRVLSNANPKLTLTRAELGQDVYAQAERINMKGSSAKVHLASKGTPRFAAAASSPPPWTRR